MKVGILTMFNGLEKTYSLVNVVAEHLTMLLEAGIKTKVLVCQDCPDHERTGIFKDDRIEWVKVTNRINGKQITWYDYSCPDGKVHDTFFAEAEIIAKDFEEKLQDIDICFIHDIHYQGWHLVHNVALRIAQKNLPHLRFIAFTHSAPVNRPLNTQWPFSARFTPIDKTLFVYPTQGGIPALARQYGIPEGYCRTVNNSFDILLEMSDDTKKIISATNPLSADIFIVYPGRFTPGKKFEKVAALAGVIKRKVERKIKIIFCDFPAMDIEPQHYKTMITTVGQEMGLENNDLFFTSDLGYPQGFPRSGVLELFTLSNLFICPSYSESFGLTVLEAASRGNFLVLNQAVPALEELGNQLKAYFMRWDARNFGFDTKENYHPSERAYLEEHGERIITLMRENPVIHGKTLVRQRYSPQWIWKNQLEPLLNCKVY